MHLVDYLEGTRNLGQLRRGMYKEAPSPAAHDNPRASQRAQASAPAHYVLRRYASHYFRNPDRASPERFGRGYSTGCWIASRASKAISKRDLSRASGWWLDKNCSGSQISKKFRGLPVCGKVLTNTTNRRPLWSELLWKWGTL